MIIEKLLIIGSKPAGVEKIMRWDAIYKSQIQWVIDRISMSFDVRNLHIIIVRNVQVNLQLSTMKFT